MKLKLYEEVIFIGLVLLLSYSCLSLSQYSFDHYFNDNNILIEGMDEEQDNEPVDPDLDINNTDYTKQMKSPKKYGFSKEGSWSTLKGNVKGIKTILDGIIFDQKKLTKKGNPIGVKLTVDTGFECSDPEGNFHKEYTYIDNEGDSNLGLVFEIGNSIGKYGGAMKNFKNSMSSSEDKICKEVELDILTNSGKKTSQTVHVDTKEIESINEKNILNEKTYSVPEEQEQEGFYNWNSTLSQSSINLLINDELFYKDIGVFTYFLLLNFLFLYFIFILVINN